jgi:hypothetical protein
MELHWEWGRQLDRDRVRPARLDLVLRNDDHKYSPPNGSSPLSGNLKAGRRVWARFAYPYDDFTGGDGTDLSGRQLPVDRNFSWVKEDTGANGFEISGNQVRAVTGGAANAIYTLDFGDADASIGLQYRRAANAHGGLALRLISASDYLRVRFANTSTVLEHVVNGTPTNIRSGDPLTAGVNYYLEVEMHGPSIRLFATDLDAGTADRQEVLDGAGVAGNASATRHGLWHDGTANTDRWDDFGGWRSFFYGLVEHIAPQPGPDRQSCHLRAYDELQRLGDTLVFNLLTGSGLRADAVVDNILNWAGFNFNDRELDSGRVLIAAGPRALWRISARNALDAVQDEEDGFIYVVGYLRLEESGHRSTGPHITSRATFRDTKSGSPYLSGLIWEDGSDDIENDITFRYHLEDDQGLQEVWRLRDVPAIPAGEMRDFLAESAVYDVVDGIRTPVPTADYTANSQPDGSGADLTADLTVSLPLTADFQGKGTVVRVANNHAADTAYVPLLKLRADHSYQDFKSTIYQTEDAASQLDHGERSRLVECLYIDTYEAARDVAEERLARNKGRQPRLDLILPNGDQNNLMQIVHRVLSDRITVVYSDMGINQDFFIERMELDVVARTGEVTARWLARGA